MSAARFEGEYGLYVGVTEDGLDVRWLTDGAEPGVVVARVDGERIAQFETPAGTSHRALLQVDAPIVQLEYGAANGAVHTTTVRRSPASRPEVRLDGIDSIYLFGDVHGEFDRVTALLRKVGLIDDSLRWSGGHRHLVMLGDLFDRGDHVTRVLWFLYQLEPQAARAGGGVHVILGNHEVMVMSSDLRYVAGKEQMIAFRHGMGYAKLFDPRVSVLGRWLAGRPGLMRIDDLLLAHGGMSPAYVDYSLGEFQDTLRAFMGEDLFLGWNDSVFLEEFARTTTLDTAGLARRWRFFFGPESVMWYRALVRSDTLGAFLDRVLDRFDARIHVVGHTPVAEICEKYGGRLIATDLEDAATEMLLMARAGDGGWERWRIPLTGEPEPLTPPPASHGTSEHPAHTGCSPPVRHTPRPDTVSGGG